MVKRPSSFFLLKKTKKAALKAHLGENSSHITRTGYLNFHDTDLNLIVFCVSPSKTIG